jgi:hypothetical protein
MRIHKTALVIPESKRYFCVDLPGKGLQHFKICYYGVATALSKLAAEQPFYEDDERTEMQKVADMLPYISAMIGACWFNRSQSLEVAFPFTDLSVSSLLEYGSKVSEELQDAEYTLLDLIDMFNAISIQIKDHQDIAKMGMDRAVFSEASREA